MHFLNRKKWWIKISTIAPYCIYYFGPFKSVKEAKLHLFGYIEDLATENAFGIAVEIKRYQPTCLTYFKE